MTNSNNDDYSYQFSPTTSLMLDDLLNPSDTVELVGLNPSNNTNLNSSTQLVPNFNHEFMPEFANNGVGYQNEKLEIIAQPKAAYRPRYGSEINQANRFIRTEDGDDQNEYPTVKIPSWCQPNQQLYIRVTLVTVISDRTPYHCIHPYEIDTPDENAIKDKPNNSLFFHINENEFNTHEKSFNIIVLKKKQDELKSYGPMRLFGHEPYENIIIENPQDPKQKIAMYQLFKAQFVFTIAQQQDNNPDLVLLPHTSVESQIITAENLVKKNSPTEHLNRTPNNIIRCIPQKGSWEGGDEIVINMPNPIKGREYTIYFDFGQNRLEFINDIIRIDTKTILIQTPLCPIPPRNENLKISIIIKDNKSINYSIEFYYIPPMKTTDKIYSYSQRNDMNKPISNKRRWGDTNEENNGEREYIQSMDRHRLRAILLKLQDHLSDADRKRLHFFLGDDVPRRIRDDRSLNGTLCLLESLFDQDKISEQDCTFLINAFDEIQCTDAVKLLKAHMKQLQSNEINPSMRSLSSLMPSLVDELLQDEDKCSTKDYLIGQTKICHNNNTIVTSENMNINPMTIADNSHRKSSLPLKRRQLLTPSSMIQKCLLLFVLLSIILVGVVIGCSIWIIHLRIKYNILNEHTKNNETIQYMRQSQTKDNETIQNLTKKMKHVLIKELRNLKRLYLENPRLRSGATTASMVVDSSPIFLEELACLEACYKCVEDNPLASHKKRATDNCGPMCDCADSCTNIPIEQIDKIYGQINSTSGDKGCFWRTYIQSLNNEIASLS